MMKNLIKNMADYGEMLNKIGCYKSYGYEKRSPASLDGRSFLVQAIQIQKANLILSIESLPLSFSCRICYDIYESKYTEGYHAEFFEKRGCQPKHHCRS